MVVDVLEVEVAVSTEATGRAVKAVPHTVQIVAWSRQASWQRGHQLEAGIVMVSAWGLYTATRTKTVIDWMQETQQERKMKQRSECSLLICYS